MNRGEVDYRIRLGVWRHVAGVGMVQHGQPIDAAVRAWALTLTWPEAVLWGPSALALWLPDAPLPTNLPIYGSVCGSHRPSRGLAAKQTELDAGEVVERVGIRIQAPLAALVDTMMLLSEPGRTSLFSWVFTRDKADPAQFIQMVRRRKGRRGAGAMARYVAMAERGVVSEGELRMAWLLEEHQIIGWKANVKIKLDNQPPYRVDFLFAKEKLIIEVDGWAYHSSRQSFEDNRWRDAHLHAAGYRVVRVTWSQLVNQPKATVGLVRSILANQ